jgi:hypothetical protein
MAAITRADMIIVQIIHALPVVGAVLFAALVIALIVYKIRRDRDGY